MDAYDKLIVAYKESTYKGMYKNILNANRRSEYMNKNLNKYSSLKSITRSPNPLKKSWKF